jgi:hypothetical protein
VLELLGGFQVQLPHISLCLNDVPKALLLNRAPRRQSHQRNPGASQQALELGCVQRVSIDDQVAEAGPELVIGQLSREQRALDIVC